VTVKTRIGIDDDHLTYRDAGLIAQEVGAAAIALHGRTVVQHYSGTARWEAITDLKELVTDIPVLGNGDIWSAEDAIDMMEQTGGDGVVVGRGCQGRPWLFADLAAACAGRHDRIHRPPRPHAAPRRWGRAPARGAAPPGCWCSSSGPRAARSETFASMWPGTSRATPWAARCATAWRRWSPWQIWTRSSPNWTGAAPT